MSINKFLLSIFSTIFFILSVGLITGCAGSTVSVSVSRTEADGTTTEVEIIYEQPAESPTEPTPEPPPENNSPEPGCLGSKEECEGEPGIYPTGFGKTTQVDNLNDTNTDIFNINDFKFILSSNNSIDFNSYSGILTVKLFNQGAQVSFITSSYYIQGNEIKASEPEIVSAWYSLHSSEGDSYTITIDNLDYSVDAENGSIIIETLAIYSSNELLGSNVRSYTYRPTTGGPTPPNEIY